MGGAGLAEKESREKATAGPSTMLPQYPVTRGMLSHQYQRFLQAVTWYGVEGIFHQRVKLPG
jgi:hypothetical protein